MLREDERIDALYSQHIQIIQSSKVFSFSLDAVLLAHFAKVPKYGRIYDLCAGNGAVGLFLASKTQAKVTMVEIQDRLADMAQRSVSLNNLQNRYDVRQQDINDLDIAANHDTTDYITCNPPYFRRHEASKTNPNPYLAIARHELKMTLSDVMRVSSQLLKTNGKLALVYRPDRLDDLLLESAKYHLAVKRLQFIYPKKNTDRPANMVLLELIKQGRPNGVIVQPPIFEYDGNDYSQEVQTILYGQAKD